MGAPRAPDRHRASSRSAPAWPGRDERWGAWGRLEPPSISSAELAVIPADHLLGGDLEDHALGSALDRARCRGPAAAPLGHRGEDPLHGLWALDDLAAP